MARRKVEHPILPGRMEITSTDEAGAGGAYHRYEIRDGEFVCKIKFQQGPVRGRANGIFMEDLLAVVRDRLQCFQAGNFACCENENALRHICEAIHWLNHRTVDREQQGD